MLGMAAVIIVPGRNLEYYCTPVYSVLCTVVEIRYIGYILYCHVRYR